MSRWHGGLARGLKWNSSDWGEKNHKRSGQGKPIMQIEEDGSGCGNFEG